jgi:hypothetical protein
MHLECQEINPEAEYFLDQFSLYLASLRSLFPMEFFWWTWLKIAQNSRFISILLGLLTIALGFVFLFNEKFYRSFKPAFKTRTGLSATCTVAQVLPLELAGDHVSARCRAVTGSGISKCRLRNAVQYFLLPTASG